MHDIECQKLLELDTPEALVFSILCDFGGRSESEVLLYIVKRLKELIDDNTHKFVDELPIDKSRGFWL